jgi:hypothetical protein
VKVGFMAQLDRTRICAVVGSGGLGVMGLRTIPLAGDFNGDGCDTLSIYRPSEARFYIANELGENDGGLGAADSSFLLGNVGDKPVWRM